MEANTEPPDIMTVKEAAEYLQLYPGTVYRLAGEGKLPCRKVGGAWRFSRRGLETWIARHDWIDEVT